MAKKQQNVAALSNGAVYYLALILQRTLLLLAAASTVILWGSLLAIAHGSNFMNAQGTVIGNVDEWNQGLTYEIDKLTYYAVALAGIGVIASVLLLVFPRVVKYQKRLVVDGVIIASFLFVVAAWCQPILRFILARVV